VVIAFATDFAKAGSKTEMVTTVLEEGQWKVIGYYRQVHVPIRFISNPLFARAKTGYLTETNPHHAELAWVLSIRHS
jgi:hypothetical protein